MRFPLRVVGDYHVDRQEVYAQQCVQLTCTNGPKSFRSPDYLSQVIYCGGYSGGVPPLPIPNREVKPASADGTDLPVGRVSSCRSSRGSMTDVIEPLFLPPLLRSCPRGRCGLHFVPTGDFRRSQCSLLRRVPDGTATQNLSTPAAPCSRIFSFVENARTAGRVETRLFLCCLYYFY